MVLDTEGGSQSINHDIKQDILIECSNHFDEYYSSGKYKLHFFKSCFKWQKDLYFDESSLYEFEQGGAAVIVTIISSLMMIWISLLVFNREFALLLLGLLSATRHFELARQQCNLSKMSL